MGESVQNPPIGIGKKKGSHNPSTMPSLDFLSRQQGKMTIMSTKGKSERKDFNNKDLK